MDNANLVLKVAKPVAVVTVANVLHAKTIWFNIKVHV